MASAASLAIMAISSLAEYASKLSDAEDREAEKRQAAYEARRRELAELRKAAGIVADYEAELKKANATAAETADSIERLSSENRPRGYNKRLVYADNPNVEIYKKQRDNGRLP